MENVHLEWPADDDCLKGMEENRRESRPKYSREKICGGKNECAEQSLPVPVGDSLKKK